MKITNNIGIGIPKEIPEAANIPSDAVLTVEVSDKKITRREADMLDFVPSELCDLFMELGIGEDTARSVLAEDNGILYAMTARCL